MQGFKSFSTCVCKSVFHISHLIFKFTSNPHFGCLYSEYILLLRHYTNWKLQTKFTFVTEEVCPSYVFKSWESNQWLVLSELMYNKSCCWPGFDWIFRFYTFLRLLQSLQLFVKVTRWWLNHFKLSSLLVCSCAWE